MRTDFPKRVTVELTNNCNLNCKVCPRRFMDEPIGFMQFHLWQKIIDELPEKTILVPFWRGESLTHPFAEIMLKMAIAKFREVQFATNGSFVSQKFFLKTLLMMDFVSVSYHTDQAIEAVKLLHENRVGTKPRIQVSVVEGERTQKYIHLLEPYVDVVRIYKEHSANRRLGHIGGRENRKFCSKLLTDMTIDYRGNVSRCCHNWKTDQPMNVRTESIRDVWNSFEYQAIRDNYPDEVCSVCDQWGDRTVGTTKELDHENY